MYSSYTDASNYEYASFSMTSADSSDSSIDFDAADEGDFTQEDLAYAVTLTPSATTGSGITLTLGSGNWNTTHKVKAGCRVVGNGGKADITATPAAQSTITASTTVDFTNTDAIASGSWNIYCTDFDSTGAVEMSEAQGSFITATGGTITTDGDYKIHTFLLADTGTDFTVTDIGTDATYGDKVEYLVVGGGGGGGYNASGGGGAGGMRYSASPGTPDHIVTAKAYTITVGDGGAGAASGINGSKGEDYVFDTRTSTGGGGGSEYGTVGGDGGSGGGGGSVNGSAPYAGGAGDTPDTTHDQGDNGGAGNNNSPTVSWW